MLLLISCAKCFNSIYSESVASLCQFNIIRIFKVAYLLSPTLFYSMVYTYFIDTQTSKELIQMDINKVMTNGTFTMNDKHTQSEHELSTLQNHAIMFCSMKVV